MHRKLRNEGIDDPLRDKTGVMSGNVGVTVVMCYFETTSNAFQISLGL